MKLKTVKLVKVLIIDFQFGEEVKIGFFSFTECGLNFLRIRVVPYLLWGCEIWRLASDDDTNSVSLLILNSDHMLLATCQNPMKEKNPFSTLCLKWHKINSHTQLLFSFQQMHTFKWNSTAFHSPPKGDNVFSSTCEIAVISLASLDLIVFIRIGDKCFQFYFVGYHFFLCLLILLDSCW